MATPLGDDPDYKPMPIGMRTGVDLSLWNAAYDGPQKAMVPPPGENYLLAWDPVRQKEAWRAPHSYPFNGGVVSTQGNLVFQGDLDGVLNAYRADTGQKLWSFNTGGAIFAAPVSYAVDGRQYVTVLSGWGTGVAMIPGRYVWKDGVRGGPTRILTFALDAKTALPQAVRPAKQTLNPPPQFGTAAMIRDGEKFYARSCLACHGAAAYGAGGTPPDLRYSGALADERVWTSIVEDGVLAENGMVSFKKNYTRDQLSAIRAYVIDRAHKSKDVK